ncbi:MAG: tetratricopeptide repeat protein [bacterium]|nr:tetratricopeptide repeat protein [bacterium]
MNQSMGKNAAWVFKITTSTGLGSGFFLKNRSLMVTNYHVIQGHRTVAVEDQFFNRYPAKVVFINPKADLAFLKPLKNMPASSTHPAFESFTEVESRDPVYVLGYPFGMPYTETKGIVSSPKQLMDGSYYVQTDAAVNPGNSGGPMVDAEGRLVGITTAKFTEADNVGFAIPVDVLKADLESYKLNENESFSVKCHSCKNLVYEKTEFCNNCGNNFDPRVFEEHTPTKAAAFVENALKSMGMNPILARYDANYWRFHHGLTLITIYFHERDYLHAMAPINELGQVKLEELYRALLQKQPKGYKLGILNNQLFFSYRIHMSDVFSSHKETVTRELAAFPAKADEMSRHFHINMACDLPIYSREAGKDTTDDLDTKAANLVARALALLKEKKWGDALAVLEEEEKLRKPMNDLMGLAYCLKNKGTALRELGETEKALQVFRETESLFRQVGDHPERANALTQQAHRLRDLDRLESAGDAHEKAAAIYLQLGNQFAYALAIYNRGNVLHSLERLEDALELLQKSTDVFKSIESPVWYFWSVSKAGLVLSDMGKHEDALAMQNKEEELATGLSNQSGLADCIYNQSLSLLELKRPEPATVAIKKAESIYRQLDRPNDIADCFEQQAMIYSFTKHYTEAMECLKKSEAIRRQSDNSDGLSENLTKQATILKDSGRIEEAAELQRDALACEGVDVSVNESRAMDLCADAEELFDNKETEKAFLLLEKTADQMTAAGDNMGLARTYETHGHLLLEDNQEKLSLSFYKKAQQLRWDMKDMPGLAQCSDYQFTVYEALEEWLEALTAMQYAEKIYRHFKDNSGLAACLSNQGFALSNLDKPAEALELFKQSEALYTQLGEPVDAAVALSDQGDVLKSLNRYSEAITAYTNAGNAFKETDEISNHGTCLLNHAEILREQRKYTEALPLYHNAVERFTKLKANEDLLEVYRLLALTLFEMKRYEEALEVHRKELALAVEIEDTAFEADSYLGQGEIYFEMKRWNDAMSFCSKAEPMLRDSEETHRLGACLEKMSQTFAYLNQLPRAMESAKEAEVIWREIDAPSLINNNRLLQEELQKRIDGETPADAPLSGAEEVFEPAEFYLREADSLYYDDEDLPKAEEVLKEAASELHKQGEFAAMADIYEFHGGLLHYEEQWNNAMILYQKAYKIRIQLNDAPGIADALTNQAEVLLDRFEMDDDPTHAMSLLKKAEQIRIQLNQKRELAACQSFQAISLALSEQLDDAHRMIINSMKLSEQEKDEAQIAYSYWILGEIFDRKGNKTNQAEAWKRSIALKKKLDLELDHDEEKLAELLKA